MQAPQIVLCHGCPLCSGFCCFHLRRIWEFLVRLSMSTRTAITDFVTYAWIGLCLASIVITIFSSVRRGLVGFCFGLLSMFGAALSFFLIFGLVVAFGEPGGPFQLDTLRLNGLGLSGLICFALGARFGLRRKCPNPRK